MPNDIEYGNPIWKTDPAAALDEASRRVRAAAATEWGDRPPTLYFHDLNALETLPPDIEALPHLQRLLFYTDQHGKRVLRGPHALADCEAIRSLHDLRVLELWETRISDLGPVSGLEKLTELYVCGSGVEDLSPLSGLRSLRVLNVSNTAVHDLGALSEVSELRDLYVSRTEIRNLAALTGLRDLETLFVNHTHIDDVSAIAGAVEIRTLNLRATDVSDLTPLAAMERLEDLDLGDCPVDDIRPLAGLVSLGTLDLGGTRVDDLTPLLDLPVFASGQAGWLHFAGTPIAESGAFEALARLPGKRCASETVEHLRRHDIFFYGLFMDEALLREQGLEPTVTGPAVLEDYRIHIGNRATLLPSDGRRAYGVVMSLSGEEAGRLYAEPSVREYVPEPVQVALLDSGRLVTADCYNLPRDAGLAGSNPAYAEKLSALVRRLGFSAEYADEIAALGDAG